MKIKVQLAGLLLGPSAFMAVLALPLSDALTPPARIVLAATAWMAVWWVTEALPIYATALLPLALFPLLAVNSAADVSRSYMDPNIVLFMGGFFLAAALQKWRLHKRIALNVLARIGDDSGRLIAGFLLVTALLSMWVSNTATALMMLPIAIAVIEDLQTRGLKEKSRLPALLMLSVAYGASIGGVATLIGTPPNIVLAAQYKSLFP
ncbi:MAG TPA: SLC13 family permease, partial [Acidobacteriota bacterium]|nr:SLC13 family permease [Acidobacteriota bacterium]